MNAAEYLRRDTSHMLICLIMLPPFKLVSKTLPSLLLLLLLLLLHLLFLFDKTKQKEQNIEPHVAQWLEQ